MSTAIAPYALVVLWRITDTCNLACGFCAHDRRLARPRLQADPQEVLRLARVLADWQDHHGQRVLLSWLGGEPLLWPPLQSVDAGVRALGLHLSLTSNGTRLDDPAWREHLLRHYAELTFSVDAPGLLHDALRGQRAGYQRLCAGIRALRTARGMASAPRLRVNSVLMRSTLAQWSTLALALAEAGVDELSVNLLGGRDRPEFHALERLSLQDWLGWRADLPLHRSRLAAYGVRVLGEPGYWDRLQAAIMGHAVPIADCNPGRQFLFLDPQGHLAPCAHSGAEYGVPLAAVRTRADLDALAPHWRHARQLQRAPACADCPSTQVSGKFRSAQSAAPGPARPLAMPALSLE